MAPYIDDLIKELEQPGLDFRQVYGILDRYVDEHDDFVCVDDTKYHNDEYFMQMTLQNYTRGMTKERMPHLLKS